MIVELHILQNFAPSNLNRDDTNSPKECQFGGYRRARISSQCIKRAIRWHRAFQESLDGHLASRSLRFPHDVKKALLDLGVQQDAANEIGRGLQAIAKKEAPKPTGGQGEGDEDEIPQASTQPQTYELDVFKTPQMIFYPPAEVQECAAQIKQALDQGLKPSDVLKRNKKGRFTNLPVFPVPRSADIALFGRMVTSAHFVNVDAACQVAHAISTHKVGIEFDFYTAVDDLQPEEDTGAGMMDDIEFNSACYYRYANIDLWQLKTNLAGKDWGKASEAERKEANELAVKTVEAFVRAAVAAIPSGKQNSFAAHQLPSLVWVEIRGQNLPVSYANAFCNPVNPKSSNGLEVESASALKKECETLTGMYGLEARKRLLLAKNGDVKILDVSSQKNLNDLLDGVEKEVSDG